MTCNSFLRNAHMNLRCCGQCTCHPACCHMALRHNGSCAGRGDRVMVFPDSCRVTASRRSGVTTTPHGPVPAPGNGNWTLCHNCSCVLRSCCVPAFRHSCGAFHFLRPLSSWASGACLQQCSRFLFRDVLPFCCPSRVFNLLIRACRDSRHIQDPEII